MPHYHWRMLSVIWCKVVILLSRFHLPFSICNSILDYLQDFFRHGQSVLIKSCAIGLKSEQNQLTVRSGWQFFNYVLFFTEVPNICPAGYCMNRGICQMNRHGTLGVTCSCPRGTQGTRCFKAEGKRKILKNQSLVPCPFWRVPLSWVPPSQGWGTPNPPARTGGTLPLGQVILQAVCLVLLPTGGLSCK